MIQQSVLDFLGARDEYRIGGLPSSTEGYPLRYYTADGDSMCADCVNGLNGSLAPDPDSDCEQWTIVACEVYWEGPTLNCSHCYAKIESAYGDPENPEEESKE
jgi:hypothetical protein